MRTIHSLDYVAAGLSQHCHCDPRKRAKIRIGTRWPRGHSIGCRAEAGIVEGDLFRRFDLGIRSDAAGAAELIDVGSSFVEIDAAGLPSAVGEDDNILRHCTPSPKECANSLVISQIVQIEM